MQGFKDEFQAASPQRLTQLTGRPHPPADAHTSAISPVTGGSVLTQAPLPAVGSVKPSRAFWEKTHTEEGEVQLLTPQSPVEPRQTPPPSALLSLSCVPPTFCAVGSGPARCARTLSAGRVAAAVVAAATGLVAAFPIGPGRASCQEEGGEDKCDRRVNSVRLLSD